MAQQIDIENLEDSSFVHLITFKLTGFRYDFAVGSMRVWTTNKVKTKKNKHGYYQLMPEHSDDGFFDWYCWVRENNQFFLDKKMCLIYFLLYHKIWADKGSPDWRKEKRTSNSISQ